LSWAVRIHVVDPSAYTPPYDHALCAALAAAGAEVELYTSRFAYGPTAPPAGYARREFFYRTASALARPGPRRAVKLAEHVPGMLRYARAARAAEVVHFQWLVVPQLDRHLLAGRAPRRPLVLTAHDILPREPRLGQRRAQRRLFDRFDALVVHSEHGRGRLVEELGVAPGRVHVIPHGAFVHLAHGRVAPPPLRSERPVVLCFGLLRPYKGLAQLLAAWRGIEGAELWIAGMPRMDVSPLRAAAPEGVRFDLRFIPDDELRGYFHRADIVVLPYLEADHSGVLFTALAFGKPLLVTDVGGLGELAAAGAARAVPAGEVAPLHGALAELLDDPARRAALAAGARAAAAGRYAWEHIGARTLALYASLLGHNPGT
jgi:glycosyltransferase involved in cell wall biosynthesis